MTDQYTVCETAMLTVLRTLTAYFTTPAKAAWQVTTDDADLLKGADYFLLARPGSFPVTNLSAKEDNYDWQIDLDIYVRYKNYRTSWSNFKAFRWSVIEVLRQNPSLGKTANVWRVSVEAAEKPGYLTDKDVEGATPNFIIQTLSITITQRIRWTGGEYAT